MADPIVGYQQAVRLVRKSVLAYADAAWRAQGSYRDADIDQLVKKLVPRVQSGQVKVAQLTSSYLAAAQGMKSVTVDRAAVTGGRGVPADDVYRRPGTTVYTELANGTAYPDAVAAGGARLASLVSTDLQMAKVRQADQSLRSPYFARVLTGEENCALCVIASTQRYTRGNLMPIHPGCDCNIRELSASESVAQVIDPDLLEETHSQVEELTGIADRGGRAPDYRDLIVTHEHGEYGPTLAWRGQKFTGPADI